MFDAYVFTEDSCRNRTEDGTITGFELQSLITYYRGIPCSMIHDIQVAVDGVDVPRETIYFSPDGIDYFTLDELTTVTSYKWEYGEQGTIFVKQEGGLTPGEHDVTLNVAVRVAYIPVPFGGSRTRRVVIA